MSDIALGMLGGAALAAVAAGLGLSERLARRSDPVLEVAARWVFLDWCAGAGVYLAVGLVGGDWIGAACAGSAAMAGISAARTDLAVGTVSDFASLVVLVAGALYASWAESDLSLLESAAGGALAGGILLLALAIVRMRSGLAGLGSGDILLGAAAGFWTGYVGVGPALLVAVAITGAFAFAQKADRTTRLPFAPGLVGGFVLVALLQELS